MNFKAIANKGRLLKGDMTTEDTRILIQSFDSYTDYAVLIEPAKLDLKEIDFIQNNMMQCRLYYNSPAGVRVKGNLIPIDSPDRVIVKNTSSQSFNSFGFDIRLALDHLLSPPSHAVEK